MADFNQPVNTTLYSLVLGLIRDMIVSVATAFDGTTDSNLPDKTKRYNTTNDKWEKYSSSSGTWSTLPFHTVIDAHIADTTLHAGVPTGAMIAWTTATAPTGYLLSQGGAYSRTTYAALFGVIGTTFGSGDGSTTFNVPDCRQRFLIGKAASGTGSTLGGTGGTIDHTHAVPAHAHAIAAHSHTMKNHTHSTPSHTHTIAGHVHAVPGHGHSTTHAYATINITSGGSHLHNIGTRDGSGSNTGDNRSAMSDGAGSTGTITTSNDGTSAHTHAHAQFAGTVGAWDAISQGVNGDSSFNTDSVPLTTNSGGSGTSGAPSDNTTDNNSTALTTATDGGSNTDSKNPPFLAVNWIIKT